MVKIRKKLMEGLCWKQVEVKGLKEKKNIETRSMGVIRNLALIIFMIITCSGLLLRRI